MTPPTSFASSSFRYAHNILMCIPIMNDDRLFVLLGELDLLPKYTLLYILRRRIPMIIQPNLANSDHFGMIA